MYHNTIGKCTAARKDVFGNNKVGKQYVDMKSSAGIMAFDIYKMLLSIATCLKGKCCYCASGTNIS